VQPGDYYAAGLDANGLPITRRATAPLTAQLSYALADPATLAESGVNGCSDLLCPGDAAQFAQSPAPVWIVDFLVAQDWRFTTTSGAVAGQAAEVESQQLSVLALSYDSSAGWRVSKADPILASSPYVDPCSVAVHMLFAVEALTPEAPSALPLSTTSGATQGCKLEVTDQTTPPQATFIFVFGALLAVDSGAHHFLPALPIAPSSEVAVVGAA
jgi:hypothetical protein